MFFSVKLQISWFQKNSQWKWTKLWLKIVPLNDYFFLFNWECLWFWAYKTCIKNLVILSQKLSIFFKCPTFSGHFSVFDSTKIQRNAHQKFDIRKKSTIFEMVSWNFLCKLSLPKTPSVPNVKQKLGHFQGK